MPARQEGVLPPGLRRTTSRGSTSWTPLVRLQAGNPQPFDSPPGTRTPKCDGPAALGEDLTLNAVRPRAIAPSWLRLTGAGTRSTSFLPLPRTDNSSRETRSEHSNGASWINLQGMTTVCWLHAMRNPQRVNAVKP